MDLKSRFQSLQIIFMSLIIGVILFGTVMSIITVTDATLHFSMSIFFFISITLSVTCILLSGVLFQLRIKNITTESTADQKLLKYQSAKIISWALLEGAILFNIVLIMLESNYLYLAIAICLLLVLVTKVPSKSKLLTEAKFSEEEIRCLD